MTPSRRRPARPTLEALETRLTPTASISQKGNLYLQYTDADDTVVVRNVKLENVDYYEVTENGTVTRFEASKITGSQVFFYGLGGNDRFENHSTLTAAAFGGAGNDVLISDAGGYLDGEAGNDTITAGANVADNVVQGGDGNDTLTGSVGRDLMYGGAGNDRIVAGAGNDYLEGGLGNDTLDGGAGDDLAHGDAGNDVLSGGAGNDQLNGGAGVDTVRGEAGNDTIWGGADLSGNHLFGGDGNDSIYGGNGGDYLYGEAGNDQLVGAGGGDRMYGGVGMDYLWGEAGNDWLDGGIDGVVDYLEGGAGYDMLRQEFYLYAGVWRQRERLADYVVRIDALYR